MLGSGAVAKNKAIKATILMEHTCSGEGKDNEQTT